MHTNVFEMCRGSSIESSLLLEIMNSNTVDPSDLHTPKTNKGKAPLVTPVAEPASRSEGGPENLQAKRASGKLNGPQAAKARIRERQRRKKLEEAARIQKLSLLVPSAANAASLVSLLSPRVEEAFEKTLTNDADQQRVRELLTQRSI